MSSASPLGRNGEGGAFFSSVLGLSFAGVDGVAGCATGGATMVTRGVAGGSMGAGEVDVDEGESAAGWLGVAEGFGRLVGDCVADASGVVVPGAEVVVGCNESMSRGAAMLMNIWARRMASRPVTRQRKITPESQHDNMVTTTAPFDELPCEL